MASAAGPERISSPTPSQLPPVPASPTYSLASTANPLLTAFNMAAPPPPRPPPHAVLTKSDLEQSQHAYADLLATAKGYRLALAALSTAASAFGSALESCARLKEARAEPLGPSRTGGRQQQGSNPLASLTSSIAALPRPAPLSGTADLLLAASGVQHLVANHQQILSETVYRSFEVPLLDELDRWRASVDDEDDEYQRAVRAQSKEIRRLEKEGLKLHKQRRRDVGRFRAHLVALTTQLDGLTALHADHARALLRESQDASTRVLDASCSLVRAEVDIYESLARKGWSGGGLDDLLERGVDLFAHDESAGGGGGGGNGGHGGGVSGDGPKLFSILPPMSILADSGSGDGVRPYHARGDSLLMDGERYQSLAGVTSAPGGGTPRPDQADAASVFSLPGATTTTTDFNRPRGARPFSPQPIRRVPTDVTYDSLGVVGVPPASTGVPARTDEEAEDADDRTTVHAPQPRRGVRLRQGDEDEDDDPWRDEGTPPGAEDTPDSTLSFEERRGRRGSAEQEG